MPTTKDMKLLSELVAIDTTTKDARNYSKMANLIREECEKLGASVEVVGSPSPPGGKPRPNLIARVDVPGASQTLAFNAHYDALPADKKDGWNTDPYTLTVKGDKAYGRGSNDDKGGITALLGALAEAKGIKANLELFFTCDEETGSELGMTYVMQAARQRIKSTSAVVVDGDAFIIVGTSAGLGGSITFRGRGGHAGYPFLATNPIECALPVLQDIAGFSDVIGKKVSVLPGVYRDPDTLQMAERPVNGRFCLTVARAGDAVNSIPRDFEVQFNMRVGPGVDMEKTVDEFVRYLEQVRQRHSRSGFEILFDPGSLKGIKSGSADLDSRIVKRAKEILGTDKLYYAFGGDDSNTFNGAGIPAIGYGLFNESAHQPNEYVLLSDFNKVKRFLRTLMESP